MFRLRPKPGKLINNNISFGHIFVILLLTFTCLCVHSLPKVTVNFRDKDDFPWFIGVELGSGNIWENNIDRCHVANSLGNDVAMVEL
jgi:hypothetical protein